MKECFIGSYLFKMKTKNIMISFSAENNKGFIEVELSKKDNPYKILVRIEEEVTWKEGVEMEYFLKHPYLFAYGKLLALREEDKDFFKEWNIDKEDIDLCKEQLSEMLINEERKLKEVE